MNDIFEKILDLIYPQICGICGKTNTKSLCNKCKVKIQKEFKYQNDNYNEDINKNFIEHHYFFKYVKKSHIYTKQLHIF